MKMIRTFGMLVVGALVVSTAYAQPAPWGAGELATSTEAAVESYKADFGVNALQDVKEINVKMRATKNAAIVTLTYGEEETDKAEYMCHTHGSEIDCH